MTALFTFLIHSTLWCGLAWLCLRLFPGTHARARETIWYMALAASFLTPTVHSLTSPDSAVWRLPMPAFIAGEEHRSGGERGHDGAVVSALPPLGEELRSVETAVPPGWLVSAGTFWFAIAGGLLTLYLLQLQGLRRRLGERAPVTDPRASRALATLSRRAALASPPRLTESENVGSPIALGAGTRREICVPVRALQKLDDGELRALLGHEVAHHLRRDTIRLAILNILQAVFFFQPLFRLAVREIRFAAEELCDDWAARQSGDRFAMASCLTEVAGWVVRRDRRSPVPCIGRRRSQLERRVSRLMNDRYSIRAPMRPWRHMSAVGLLILAPVLAPGVAPVPDASHDRRRAIESPWPREHLEPGEHELHERRERDPAWSPDSPSPAGDGELRAAHTCLPPDILDERT